MRLRDLSKANTYNLGNRSLLESIMIPEVEQAFRDWIKNSKTESVLIGGIALSFYLKPRSTTDIDILFLSADQIPDTVSGFKRTRKLAFQHNQTYVEIEVLPYTAINIPQSLALNIFNTARIVNGIKVASPEGLIAAKLHRLTLQDKADIGNLISYLNFSVDLSEFDLPTNLIDELNKITSFVSTYK